MNKSNKSNESKNQAPKTSRWVKLANKLGLQVVRHTVEPNNATEASVPIKINLGEASDSTSAGTRADSQVPKPVNEDFDGARRTWSDPNDASWGAEQPSSPATEALATDTPMMTDFVDGKFVQVPAVKAPEMVTYGGYTGIRMSQLPGAHYETGMPITTDMLTNPKPGDPQVPHLGPGDPRINSGL